MKWIWKREESSNERKKEDAGFETRTIPGRKEARGIEGGGYLGVKV